MLPPGYTAVHNSRLPWTVLFNLFCFVLCLFCSVYFWCIFVYFFVGFFFVVFLFFCFLLYFIVFFYCIIMTLNNNLKFEKKQKTNPLCAQ